jgi:O-6-methylguanine DNA methyltransferase
METLYYAQITSPIGPLNLAVSDRGLVVLEFHRDGFPRKSKSVGWTHSEAKIAPFAVQVTEYFAGERREFTFPLDLRGTPFQLACWHALLAIPYGETRTYADMANNRNPIAIVVPCHRVIASDGTLCGYGGGLDVKRRLLELEGALTGVLAA